MYLNSYKRFPVDKDSNCFHFNCKQHSSEHPLTLGNYYQLPGKANIHSFQNSVLPSHVYEPSSMTGSVGIQSRQKKLFSPLEPVILWKKWNLKNKWLFSVATQHHGLKSQNWQVQDWGVVGDWDCFQVGQNLPWWILHLLWHFLWALECVANQASLYSY